jgi:stage II sporulation protein R
VGGFALQALYQPTTAQIAFDTGNLLRLHVLANSDAPDDQELKLAVRDAIIPLLGRLTASAQDADAAEAAVKTNVADLVGAATAVVRRAGRDYSIKIETGDFSFPTKSSPAATLPAGEYRAVRVLIGEARGHNWWCVLFPPMCYTTDATAVAARTNTVVKSAGQVTLGKRKVKVAMRYIPSMAGRVYVTKIATLWHNSVSRVSSFSAAEARTRNSSTIKSNTSTKKGNTYQTSTKNEAYRFAQRTHRIPGRVIA